MMSINATLAPPAAKSWLQQALPNAVTILALWVGMSGLIFAVDGEVDRAIACVFAAALLDACDGRVARITGTASRFGAELDSLSDVVCFGAVPAFLLHNWGLKDFAGAGWFVCLLLAGATALRLARFNVTAVDPNRPARSASFFQGVPAPAGAFLSLLPVYVANAGLMSPAGAASLGLFSVPLVAALMVSSIPTFSGKAMGRMASLRLFLPASIAIALICAGLVVNLWSTVVAVAAFYLLTLPLSLWRHSRLVARAG
jgi:CDP-diacylglycerol--serine O-phosphatidyltransferase